MKPAQVSETLRRIASAIEASKNPSRKLVTRDLKSLLSRVANQGSVAPTVNVKLTSCVLAPGGAVDDPEFDVEGTIGDQAFQARIGMSLSTRLWDWEGDEVDVDEQVEVISALEETDAWKAAWKAFEESGA